MPLLPPLFYEIFAFLFGMSCGSFLGALTYRLPRDISIVAPRSFCPSCKAILSAIDLIPIFSFIFLKGRCRHCGSKISARYFIIELFTATGFLASVLFYGLSYKTLWAAIFFALSVAIFVIDLEHYVIPDILTLLLAIVGVVKCSYELLIGKAHLILYLPGFIYSIAFGGLLFFFIRQLSLWIFKREGMGAGDVLLAAAIGANFGIKAAGYLFLLAIFLGAVIGGLLQILKLKRRWEYIPFGPFLVTSALAFVFTNNYLIKIIDSLWASWLAFWQL